MAVWAVVVPGVLLSRELNYFNLADKTQRLLCAGKIKLHLELRCAFGIFVNCEQGPLLVRSSHCIRSYGRARHSRPPRLRRQAVRAVFRFVYGDRKYFVLLAYRLHPFFREELSSVVSGETVQLIALGT